MVDRAYRVPREDESVATVVSRVAEAGQRYLNDRLDLAKLEAREALKDSASMAVLGGAGGLLLLGGWAGLMTALVLFLDEFLPLTAALAIVAGAHALVGGGLLLAALRKGRSAGEEGARARQALTPRV